MVDKIHCAICGAISNRATEVDDTILCKHCFGMMLNAGLLFEYEADTDWHYGSARTLEMERLEDRKAMCDDVLEIVKLLR